MKISLIVAFNQKRVIGKENTIPWHSPEDLKRFKKLTLNKPIIMGRKTYESIGKPLPKRVNVVLTKSNNFYPEHLDNNQVIVSSSLSQALEYLNLKGYKEVFIVGGSTVYTQSLPLVDELYLSIMKNDEDGDTHFPELNQEHWKEVKLEECEDHTFCILKRST